MECNQYSSSSGIFFGLRTLYATLQQINNRLENCKDVAFSVQSAKSQAKAIEASIPVILAGDSLKLTEVQTKLDDYKCILELLESNLQEQQKEKEISKGASNQVQQTALRIQEIQTKKGPQGQSPLHMAALQNNSNLLRSLLAPKPGESTVDVNVRDSAGNTPLHIAAGSNNLEGMKLLLRDDADKQATNDNGLTPLHLALRHGASDCFNHLIEEFTKGGTVKDAFLTANREQITLLHLAAKYNRLEMLKTVLKIGEGLPLAETGWPDLKDSWEQTPLHYAVIQDNVGCAQLLIQYGANIDQKDQIGMTPILSAASCGKSRCVELLMNKGADLTVQNNHKRNIIHLLTNKGDLNLLKQVIHGLKTKVTEEELKQMINSSDDQNITPLEIAKSTDQEDVRHYLIECGAEERSIEAAICAICHRILNQPTLLACGHVFCAICVELVAKNRDTCVTCQDKMQIVEIDGIGSRVLKKNFGTRLKEREEEDVMDPERNAFIRAKKNINALAKALKTSLDLDRHHTVILSIEDTFPMHITHMRRSKCLCVYSPILSDFKAYPARILTRLYWTLLEFGLNGFGSSISGVGIILAKSLIVVHANLPMLHATEGTLREFSKLYFDLIKKWRELIEGLIQLEPDENFLENWLIVRDQLANKEKLSSEEQEKLEKKLTELGKCRKLIQLADEIQKITYPKQFFCYKEQSFCCEAGILKENIDALLRNSGSRAAYNVEKMPDQNGMETYLICPREDETLAITVRLDAELGFIRLSCVIIQDLDAEFRGLSCVIVKDSEAYDGNQQKNLLEALLSASMFGSRTAGGVLTRERIHDQRYNIILHVSLSVQKDVKQENEWIWNRHVLMEFLPMFIGDVNNLKALSATILNDKS